MSIIPRKAEAKLVAEEALGLLQKNMKKLEKKGAKLPGNSDLIQEIDTVRQAISALEKAIAVADDVIELMGLINGDAVDATNLFCEVRDKVNAALKA